MNPNKIAFIYCVNDHSKFEKSKLDIEKLNIPPGFEIDIVPVKGAESMAAGYNIGMNKSDAKYKVYIHEDVNILNLDLLQDILKLFSKYPKLGLIGAIGSKTLPVSGVWSESSNRYGKVYESSPGYMRLLSNQEVSDDYESVQAVDGLVMITQYDIPWRADILKGWHFYNVSQCLEFLKAGYEVGVPKQQEPWFKHDCGIMDLNGYEGDRKILIEQYRKDIERLNQIHFDNYFSYHMELFLEFVEKFMELSYKGIPLALLIRFERYIDEHLHDYIIRYSKNKTLNLEQIQPSFNRIINQIKKISTINKKNKPHNKEDGKVLIFNTPALRFPDHTFVEYFDPNKTIILESNMVGNYGEIPAHSLATFSGLKRGPRFQRYGSTITTYYVHKAKEIFSLYPDHPIFSYAKFQNKFIEEIPIILHYLIKIDNYLNSVPVSCVIVGQTGDFDVRSMALMAAIKEIPCICTQHGVLMGRLDTCYFPVFAAKQAVYGEFEKECYRQLGVQDDCVEITGHPRYDTIFNQSKISKDRFVELMGIDPNKKIILIIATPKFDFTLLLTGKPSYYWNEFVELLVKNPNVEIIIKPTLYEFINQHLMEGYLDLSSKYNSVKILGTKIDLYDILPNVDVVAVENSTVGLEAMLFDKPTVCLAKEQAFWVNTHNYYSKLDVFYQTDPIKLVKIINQLFEDEQLQKYAETIRKKFLKESYTNKHEFSGKLLSDLISRIIGEKSFHPIKGINDGMLIRSSDGKVYLVERGMKRHIVSPSVFEALGLEWGNIRSIDDRIIDKIPTGFVISSKEKEGRYPHIETD
jgi:CDP-glycerol glycerophosphotransferase (TagB/SpsB family)